MSNQDPSKKQNKKPTLSREDRLAQELRANLRRRKAALKRQNSKNEL